MPKEGEQGLSKYLPSKMGPSWLQGVPQGGVTTSQKTLATEEVVCLQGKSSVQCTNIQIMTKTELMAFHWVLVRKGVFPLPAGFYYHHRLRELPLLVSKLYLTEVSVHFSHLPLLIRIFFWKHCWSRVRVSRINSFFPLSVTKGHYWAQHLTLDWKPIKVTFE